MVWPAAAAARPGTSSWSSSVGLGARGSDSMTGSGAEAGISSGSTAVATTGSGAAAATGSGSAATTGSGWCSTTCSGGATTGSGREEAPSAPSTARRAAASISSTGSVAEEIGPASAPSSKRGSGVSSKDAAGSTTTGSGVGSGSGSRIRSVVGQASGTAASASCPFVAAGSTGNARPAPIGRSGTGAGMISWPRWGAHDRH